MKTTLGQRVLSLFLTLVMCMTLAPAALAAGETLTLSQTEATLDVNSTLQLTATSTAADFQPANVEWESSDITIAKVDGGTVTAVAPGEATITAIYKIPETPDPTTRAEGDTITAECRITVTNNLTNLELKWTNTDLEAGKTLHLTSGGTEPLAAELVKTPETADVTASLVRYTWTSKDPNIVSVTDRNYPNSTITGRGEGETEITLTATYTTGGKTFTARKTCTVDVTSSMNGVRLNPSGPLTLEVGGRQNVTAMPDPETAQVKWESVDTSVVRAGTTDPTGHEGTIAGVAPGSTIVKAYVVDEGGNRKEATMEVEVSGIVLGKTSVSVQENDMVDMPVVYAYGAAKTARESYQSTNTNVAAVSGGYVVGRGPGTTTITIYRGANYQASFTVTVSADPKSTIQPEDEFKLSDTLKFDTLLGDFRNQAVGNLSHLTGLHVDPAQGTLYYRYNTASGPEGVAQTTNYYYNPTGVQKSLGDITFVPNSSYTGSEITISYTVVSDTYQNTSGRIILKLEKAQASNEMYLNATHSYPAQFSSTDFNRLCQQNYGASLDYVTFSLPPSSQGILYTDYISEADYGSKVTTGTHYRRQDLDKVFFVPNSGFSGTATIYYTARSVGTPGTTYSGQVIISVSRESFSSGDKLVYECYAGSTVTLDDARFNSYWRDELHGSGNLNYIRFDALPAASQGTLYYHYRSSSNTGSPVQTGVNYYYGTYTPRLDYVTFVPNQDFAGTVYIPFTGYSNNGDRFSGSIEIDVRGLGGSGNIWYVCAPGRTRSFDISDFNRLSSNLTGRNIDYIIFQDLPNSTTQGSIYHNNSRVTSTSRQYRNGSTSYRIQYLSFRAASGFSGTVDIPFSGRSANSVNFNGVLTISSTGGNWDTTIRYSTDYSTAAVFDRDDFDYLSEMETDRSVSTVRFDVPSSSQGSLYRNYYSSSSRGTRITSSTYSASASELNRLAFIPASGFTGTVLIDFTGTAQSNGGTFTGTVEIEVGRPNAAVTARYSTRTAPVNLRSEDLRRSGYTLSSIQFTSLPAASEGRLYYRYTSPTQYDRQASTGTSYRVSGSNLISDLTFVPRAGYTGTVYIPYTGTNSNGSTFEGEVAITVSPTSVSTHFNDMGRYSNDARAAVEYLYDLNVTRGISSTEYGPELNISRGDFAVMVYKAFGFTPSGSYQIFSDVPSSARYAQAVNTLYSKGIVSGVGSNSYGPNANISRQDAICMVHRAMRSIGWSTNNGSSALLNSYSDGSSVSGYARSDMANAVWQGYLPTVNGRLDPAAPLTRVDMAQILHRVLTY